MNEIFRQGSLSNEEFEEGEGEDRCKSQNLKFTGMTLKEYFQRTDKAVKLNKIQQEQESESQLQYGSSRKMSRKERKNLKSLTRLKQYQLQLQKTVDNRERVVKKLSPCKKFTYSNDQGCVGKLPEIHHKSFSPQIKNLKLQIMNKFRQHYRNKTEMQQIGSNHTVANKAIMKRLNHPIMIHITKKKLTCNPGKFQLASTRGEQPRQVDGFMMTFSKTRGRKLSEINLVDFSKKTKRY